MIYLDSSTLVLFLELQQSPLRQPLSRYSPPAKRTMGDESRPHETHGPHETNRLVILPSLFSNTVPSDTNPLRALQAPPPECPDIGHPNACRCSKPESKLPETSPERTAEYERERLHLEESGHKRPRIFGRFGADADMLDRLDSERWIQRTANHGDLGETRIATAAPFRLTATAGEGARTSATATDNSVRIGFSCRPGES